MERNWKIAARRSILGEKVPILIDGEEFYIRPRKYSVRGSDEINTEILRIASAMPRGALEDIRKKAKKSPSEKAIGTDEAMALLGKVAPGSLSMVAVVALKIRHGVGEHNLEGEIKEAMTAALVEEIMEFPSVSAQVFAAVEAFNAPLD